MKTNEEYSHLNEELENYFANTIIPQLFVDGNMILRKFTPPAMTQFSFSEDDVNTDFRKVKDNIKYPTIIENIEEVFETGEILEKEIQTTDKEWFQMNILPYVVRKENRTNGVIITFVNITERVSALREMERMNVRNDTLLYALTHDIRQPLSTLLLLKTGLTLSYNEQNKQLFNKLTDQFTETINSMTSLLNNFIAENEVELDDNAEQSRLNIQQIFKEVQASFKNEIRSRNVEITTDFQATEIKFSRTNLRSIIYNLLGNAIKFQDEKKPLAIHVSTEKEDKFIVLRIKDTGRGISEDNLQTIFERSRRLNEDVEGTGMGLYIIKRMVENNDGKVEVESTPGQGTTFSIYIPLD